jgi:4'-phosphopantetheinyl transferase EntD
MRGWLRVAIGIDAEVNEPLPHGVLAIVARDEEVARIDRRRRQGVYWDRALFSAKESVFKAWYPLTGRWLDFEDVTVNFESRSNRFKARFLAEKPIVEGRQIRFFDGKIIVQAGRIITAVFVKRN